jgi:HEAT repeat protein
MTQGQAPLGAAREKSVPELVRDLGHRDRPIRQYAADQLEKKARAGEDLSNFVPELENSLRTDVDVKVRRSVAQALGLITDRSTIQTLITASNDADSHVRFHVVEALGKFKLPCVIPALENALKDEFHRVVDVAFEGLVNMNTTESFAAIIKALGYPNDSLRGKAARVLGEKGRVEAIDPLFEALKQAQSQVESISRPEDKIEVDTIKDALDEIVKAHPEQRKKVLNRLINIRSQDN